MNKVYGNYLIDPDFKNFLEYMKTNYGMVQSRIVALSVIEKYKDEYAKFLETYEERTEKN